MSDFKEVYNAGLCYLARREHSTLELARKLRAKGFHQDHISPVLHDLISHGYLSDIRFAENYIRSRLNSGWGPVIIVQELTEKGVASDIIRQKMASLQDEWFGLACQVRRKKFGAVIPKAFAEMAKQKRFLQYRGFTFEQIGQVFDRESSSE